MNILIIVIVTFITSIKLSKSNMNSNIKISNNNSIKMLYKLKDETSDIDFEKTVKLAKDKLSVLKNWIKEEDVKNA